MTINQNQMIPREVLKILKENICSIIANYYLENNDLGINDKGEKLYRIGTNNLVQIEGSNPVEYEFIKGLIPGLKLSRILLMFNCLNKISSINLPLTPAEAEEIEEHVAIAFIEKLETILHAVGLAQNLLSMSYNKYGQFYRQVEQTSLLKSNAIRALNMAVASITTIRNSYGLGETTAYDNIAITPSERSCSIM